MRTRKDISSPTSTERSITLVSVASAMSVALDGWLSSTFNMLSPPTYRTLHPAGQACGPGFRSVHTWLNRWPGNTFVQSGMVSRMKWAFNSPEGADLGASVVDASGVEEVSGFAASTLAISGTG